MTTPRLEIDLDKIHHNARSLVDRLAVRGITVTGVTKATLGSPEIAEVLLRAGAAGLGDSRIENIEAMRGAGLSGPIALVRSPMISQVDRVVAHADLSFNTELVVIEKLSIAAVRAKRTHGVLLMVELGDLREGIMPADLEAVVRETLRFPGLGFKGIGTNLACRSGAAPDPANMAELSALADSIAEKFGRNVAVVSGGNSANLNWALNGEDVGRINNLRLGESILLGCETLHREPIDGLYTDAVTLVAEVIESKLKPSLPAGDIAQTAFGNHASAVDHGTIWQTIVALGHQDTDPDGLIPPDGFNILGASSDHLIADTGSRRLSIGSEMAFQLNYSALVRAMTSPFVAKAMKFQNDQVP